MKQGRNRENGKTNQIWETNQNMKKKRHTQKTNYFTGNVCSAIHSYGAVPFPRITEASKGCLRITQVKAVVSSSGVGGGPLKTAVLTCAYKEKENNHEGIAISNDGVILFDRASIRSLV